MNVLVIGTGAIGSFYGSLLAKAGANVSVLARSDYTQVEAHGIDISSDTQLGNWHFKPSQVVRQASALSEKPDYILLCVKVVDGADRAGLIRDAIGEKTKIVLISNGVEIEDEMARAFPYNEIISGLAFICVTRTEPGKVRHQAYGRLVLGRYPAGKSHAAEMLADRFKKSGIGCAASDDIVTARWQKCLWNAAFNPLSVLSGGLSTNDILSTQEPLVRALMAEVCHIASAVGHPLPAAIIDQQIESTYKMPPYKTSMLLDFEANRPMETEAILGNTLRAGLRTGVNIPHLTTLYALMKMRELQRDNSDQRVAHSPC
ncbi:MAG: ketopantoate reductase family protein [Methylococcaceae bacterium]|jgi:2-dehydropantoate 2-reductase